MINKIAKVTIYVNNQEAAKTFWLEKMNFVVKAEHPMGPSSKWLEVATKDDLDTSFVIFEKEAMKAQNPSMNTEHPSIILTTINIDETYEELKAKEVKVGELMKMQFGAMFNFFDQDGNQYLVREDK